jgi:SSS family solute:Na+ symporter
VLAWWVGPAIRRVAARHDLRTVGDFLEWRYGPGVRAVVAALLGLATVAILAGQLIGIAWVLHAVAGIPKVWGCLIGGVVMTIYFTAGGLLGSSVVNLVQLAVELAAFAIAIGVALAGIGGFEGLRAATPTGDYWSLWQGGESGWMYVALLGPSFVVSPGLLQKVYGARDDRTVRIGVAAQAVVLLVFAFVTPLLGMIARAYNPGLAPAAMDMALPMLLADYLPPLVGALGLAALFSTEVNTAEALLFMLSTSVSRDLYHRHLRPAATDSQVLRAARAAAVAGGLAGVSLAIVLPSIIDALTVFYAILSVTLFVPVVAGLYAARAQTPEAMAAIVGGLLTILVFQLGRGAGLGPFTPAMLGLLAAAASFAVVYVGRRVR